MNNFVDLPKTGLEFPLSEVEQLLQNNCHRFAKEVMRPAGIELDKVTPEEMIAPGSKFWDVLDQAESLGLSVKAMAAIDPLERANLFAIATEELSWGDAGLSAALLVHNLPGLYSLIAGNMEMVDFCEGKRGCWAITEPDHGSDMLDANASVADPNGKYGRPNCIAEIQGNKIIINGQKSAWVSGAMTAEIAVLFCHAKADGKTKLGVAVIVPLDSPGVTRGKPLDKLGLRCLNQGELFFQNVEVPLSQMLAGPDTYDDLITKALCDANPYTGLLFLGAGRAAFEHAYAYAHERKAGGVVIIKHQVIQYRLFHMFRKLEAARALLRRTLSYNATATYPSLVGACASKITATQFAFEVASDALQIFAGNGMTKEYPMEKLLRDTRSGLVSDGCNELLALKAGKSMINPELIS